MDPVNDVKNTLKYLIIFRVIMVCFLNIHETINFSVETIFFDDLKYVKMSWKFGNVFSRS